MRSHENHERYGTKTINLYKKLYNSITYKNYTLAGLGCGFLPLDSFLLSLLPIYCLLNRLIKRTLYTKG